MRPLLEGLHHLPVVGYDFLHLAAWAQLVRQDVRNQVQQALHLCIVHQVLLHHDDVHSFACLRQAKPAGPQHICSLQVED